MDSEILFVGLPFDDDREQASPADVRRLAVLLEQQGFCTAPSENGRALHVWQDHLVARVTLEDSWMLQIAIELLDLVGDANRRNVDLLSALIGTAAGMADTYLGFVSTDRDDDVSFVVEDRPARIDKPLALVYLGRRYLCDWPDEPAFAAGADLDATHPSGRLIVPSLAAFY